MANGYGSSSGSSSSQSSPSPQQDAQEGYVEQGQTAPPGFHYMPDGSLMSDSMHASLYEESNDICNQTFPIPEYLSMLTPASGYHIWEVCAINSIIAPYPPGQVSLPITYPTPSTSGMTGTTITFLPGQLVGPFNFYGNPLWVPGAPNYASSVPLGNPIWNGAYPNLFYDWVVQTVGPISIGSRIEFDISMVQPAWFQPTTSGLTHPHSAICTSNFTNGLAGGQANKICMKYLGVTSGPNTPLWPNSSSLIINNMAGSVSLETCDCKRFGLDPTVVDEPSTFDCIKKKVMGQGSGGTPYVHQCVEVFPPAIGQYATFNDCLDDCGHGELNIITPELIITGFALNFTDIVEAG